MLNASLRNFEFWTETLLIKLFFVIMQTQVMIFNVLVFVECKKNKYNKFWI